MYRIKSLAFLYIIFFIVFSCSSPQEKPLVKENTSSYPEKNLLEAVAPNDWSWMNTPEGFSFESGRLRIKALKGSDFFNNPENEEISASAPFIYQNAIGDFVAVAYVEPNFDDQWNACSLMMHIDSLNWIKFAFENSDATGPSVVTVVTKGVSDDANGVKLEHIKRLWLKLVRKNDLYAMHWSLDAVTWKMARLTRMPPADTVKVGLEAQCPVGTSTQHSFHHFSITPKTVADLRQGE